MPWAHLQRGHALVSIFTDRLGPCLNATILAITDLMMLVAGTFIAWRLMDGMFDKLRFHETTLLLRLPLGWAYGVCLIGAVVLVPVALFMFGRSLDNAIKGQCEPRQTGGGW